LSVPNQCASDGGVRASLSCANVGSVLVNSCGTAAITTNSVIRIAETQNSGLRRNSPHASDSSERGWSPLRSWSSGAGAVTPPEAGRVSVMADPRVEYAVQHVDDQVGEQRHQHQAHDGADDRGAVLGVDAAEQEAADAVDVEDAFGDDRAAHQVAQVVADEGDHRDQGV